MSKVKRKQLAKLLASLTGEELQIAELMTNCYSCKLFEGCDAANAIFETPGIMAEYLARQPPTGQETT